MREWPATRMSSVHRDQTPDLDNVHVRTIDVDSRYVLHRISDWCGGEKATKAKHARLPNLSADRWHLFESRPVYQTSWDIVYKRKMKELLTKVECYVTSFRLSVLSKIHLARSFPSHPASLNHGCSSPHRLSKTITKVSVPSSLLVDLLSNSPVRVRHKYGRSQAQSWCAVFEGFFLIRNIPGRICHHPIVNPASDTLNIIADVPGRNGRGRGMRRCFV